MKRPAFELAGIIKQYGKQFEQQHQPLKYHRRVLNALEKCRTAALGGHLDACDSCGHQRISYNSCRNRHCPKCQGAEREKWILARQEDLLPTTYFHVVFTLPEHLNSLCLKYPRQMYNMLFAASKETIMQFGWDQKHLGAKTGMVAVLHTWGQQLWLHPHLHCIVPGGGISKAGHWKDARGNGKYLFPVKALSLVFRGKYVEKLKAFFKEENLPSEKGLLDKLFSKPWVVYGKQPFMGSAQVIEYLGRYTHKIAISNHRITQVADGKVSFSYKDYRTGANQKIMQVGAVEFLRRFCMHILPPKFVKVRHYGILASRTKPKLKMQQMKMGISIVPKAKPTWKQVALQVFGFDPEACPCCKTGKMHIIMHFPANAPPPSFCHLNKKIKP